MATDSNKNKHGQIVTTKNGVNTTVINDLVVEDGRVIPDSTKTGVKQ